MRKVVWVAVAMLVLASLAIAQPGRLPATKKLIEYGWDVPTPAFVRDNISEMEKRPFDGLIMRVSSKGHGNIFSGGKWDVADYQGDFAALRAIKWGKFRHNFLMMYSASQQDWFSDEDWQAVLSNVDLMARAAKAGGCYLAFDAEPYGHNPWAYAEQKHAKDKTFAEYQAKARQRGQQFIKVIARHLPDNVLLTFFTYSIFPGEMSIQDPARRDQALAQHGYGLYHSFLNGMLDEIGPRMSITDGNEPSYYYENSEKYFDAFHMMRQRALNLVPPEDVVKHQTQMQVSQALYMDYVFARVNWKGIPALWMKDDERAKWFEHNVYWALKTTDEFVWLYSEKMNWWTNKDIPAGMEEAIVRAREAIANNRPLGFDLRDRMKEIEARKQAEIRDKLIRRTADIPVLKAMPPKLDGILDDDAWKSAAQLPNFVGYFGATEDEIKAKTRASVTYDANNLYIAISAQEPTPDKLSIVGANRDDAVWNGDTFDVFLTAAASGLPYYHFILNPKNVQWEAVFETDNSMDFNPDWRSATRIGDKEWTAEMAIPWKDLKISPQPEMRLRANLCRQRIPGKEQSCWSQTVRGFMESDNFGTWVLK